MLKRKISELLLQSKAIKLNPANPFTWASGWKSPIYCDNRKTLSFPEVRKVIKEGFISCVKEHFGNADLIAGVATGGIPQGAMVADALDLPFVYVRSAPKSHGLERLVEGEVGNGAKVVVIEDLVSTGKSSINAVNALRNEGCEVLGMIAIFTYGFIHAEQNFLSAQCVLHSLTDYETLIDAALENNYIDSSVVDMLKQWRKDPGNWTGKS